MVRTGLGWQCWCWCWPVGGSVSTGLGAMEEAGVRILTPPPCQDQSHTLTTNTPGTTNNTNIKWPTTSTTPTSNGQQHQQHQHQIGNNINNTNIKCKNNSEHHQSSHVLMLILLYVETNTEIAYYIITDMI